MDSSAENSRIVSVYILGSLGFIFIVLQCQLIYVICIYKDFRSNLTYVIIAIGSVTELVQNVAHFYSALCLLFDSQVFFDASKVFGALTVASFSSSISVAFVLGLNRLNVFKPKWIWFEIKDIYLYVLLFIIVVSSIAMFFVACTPLMGFVFNKAYASWMFEGSLAMPFLNHSFWLNSVLLSGTLICYVLIFWAIITKRKLITGNKVASSEIKLLIGATVQFILVLFVNIALKFQSSLPHLFIYANLTLTCGVKPIIHLVVNKKLRQRYFHGMRILISAPQKVVFSSGQQQPIWQKRTVSVPPQNRVIRS